MELDEGGIGPGHLLERSRQFSRPVIMVICPFGRSGREP